MNKKHILLVGGGSAFGAIAAVTLMKAQPSSEDQTSKQGAADSPEKTATTERIVQQENPYEKTATPYEVSDPQSVLEKIAEENPEINLEELESRREEFSNAMKERQMERLTGKMAKWSAALGLDTEQQKKMVEIADQQITELEGIAVSASESSDPAAISESAKRAMAIINGNALEESMTDFLTPEQQERYTAFNARQTQSRAESQTLRQLAGLQEDLMLTPEQRNDVYGVLYQNSLASVEDDSGINSLIDTFASQSGISIDPSLQSVISQIANDGLESFESGQVLDRASATELAQNAANQSIESQIEQLRPILSEGQLNLYRSQLESRVNGLINLGRSAGQTE